MRSFVIALAMTCVASAASADSVEKRLSDADLDQVAAGIVIVGGTDGSWGLFNGGNRNVGIGNAGNRNFGIGNAGNRNVGLFLRGGSNFGIGPFGFPS